MIILKKPSTVRKTSFPAQLPAAHRTAMDRMRTKRRRSERFRMRRIAPAHWPFPVPIVMPIVMPVVSRLSRRSPPTPVVSIPK
jgi:hypothetical protein